MYVIRCGAGFRLLKFTGSDVIIYVECTVIQNQLACADMQGIIVSFEIHKVFVITYLIIPKICAK